MVCARARDLLENNAVECVGVSDAMGAHYAYICISVGQVLMPHCIANSMLIFVPRARRCFTTTFYYVRRAVQPRRPQLSRVFKLYSTGEYNISEHGRVLNFPRKSSDLFAVLG